jgi:hypothetical protein
VRAKPSTKDDYQREFMANKRRRDNKILLLENLLAGAPVAREDRVLIISKQYVIWDKEHKAYLSKKGKLSWEERNTATREFWRTKEEELDALIKEAQNAAKPATKTRSQKR